MTVITTSCFFSLFLIEYFLLKKYFVSVRLYLVPDTKKIRMRYVFKTDCVTKFLLLQSKQSLAKVNYI